MGKIGGTVSMKKVDRENINKRYIYHFFKRVFDFFASLVGLILLSPLLLYIAFRIHKEDRGPVFYSQTRVGKDGKEFEMYKFRSMIVDADKKLAELKSQNEVEGPMFKMKEDPRITKIGKFIRKHSFDELPQLLNVLKGDMSLVGPRPGLPREVEEYSLTDRKRLDVTPGITCLWQVKGRSDIPFHQQVQLDNEYIQSQGFWSDMKILLMTIPAVITGKGAY